MFSCYFMRRSTIICLLLCVVLLSSCGGSASKNSRNSETLDTLYTPRYASGFEMFRHGKSTMIHIINPWQGADSVSQWIFLSRDGEKAPADFDGITVPTPICKAVCPLPMWLFWRLWKQTLLFEPFQEPTLSIPNRFGNELLPERLSKLDMITV